MKKTAYKLRPADYWHIAEYEEWFAEMATHGLFVQKMGERLIRFEKAQPRRVRYHIVLTQRKRIGREQVARYEEAGWQYVTSYQYFHVRIA